MIKNSVFLWAASGLFFCIILISFPLTAPAPPSAIQVGTNDYYSHMNETYGVTVKPKVQMGTVSDPTLLTQNGIKAKKGDAVEIHDIGNGKVKLVHPRTGKSIVIKLPAKK